MAYFEFPHTRTYEGDLGYIIKKLVELTEKYDVFFKNNTIKFANPINWDITSQYPAYTIVFDTNNNVSMISVQPVPAGIDITNTDYWELVGPLTVDGQARLSIETILKFITNTYEAGTTATAVRDIGDYVIVGGDLYIVTAPINVGETYTSGYNMDHTTVENMISDLVNVLSFYVTPEMFGAVGDGLTNDWEAIQKAVDYCQDLGGGTIMLSKGKTYMIEQAVCIAKDNITIIGYGATIKRTGVPGYYGDIIDVMGLRNGLEYYGVYGDYSTRTLYTGVTTPSKNINIFGLNIVCDGTSGSMNGIGAINAYNVLVKDCIVDNVPKLSFVGVITADLSLEAKFENCVSLNSNAHGFRATAYSVTSPTSTFYVDFVHCREQGSTGINNGSETPQASGFICGLYLNGADLDERCNISVTDCNFENGIIQAGTTGIFNFYNNIAKFYYGYVAASAVSVKSVENIMNCLFTGYANATYPHAIRITNKHEINIINCRHMLDSSYTALSFLSPEKLTIDNVSDGAIEIKRDRNTESHSIIKNCTINSLSRLGFNTYAGGSIEFDNCTINFADTFDFISGHADTYYYMHDCTINRAVSTSGYYTIRSMVLGNFHDNKMILSGTAPNSERFATPSALINVYNNRIIQTDTTEIIDYGGRSAGAPAAGYHKVGETVIESAPTAGGYIGYVCTTAGTPGTWKGYGAIES